MKIYTDGSTHSGKNQKGASNKGGFGVVVVENDEIIEKYGEYEDNTTNNAQEMKAILYAFKKYGTKDFSVPTVVTDSAYAYNTFTTWMFFWARNGWKKSDKKVPENLSIIKEFYNLWNKGYRIHLEKCKGHAGDPYNELADKIAKGEIDYE